MVGSRRRKTDVSLSVRHASILEVVQVESVISMSRDEQDAQQQRY